MRAGSKVQVGRCPLCRPYARKEEARESEPWTWQGAACGHGREAGDLGSENQRLKGEGGHVWTPLRTFTGHFHDVLSCEL